MSEPKPYRHIRTVEILLAGSPLLDDLRRWLTSHGFKFDLLLEHDGETERNGIVGIRLHGFETA